jgi:hypothetical protein
VQGNDTRGARQGTPAVHGAKTPAVHGNDARGARQRRPRARSIFAPQPPEIDEIRRPTPSKSLRPGASVLAGDLLY